MSWRDIKPLLVGGRVLGDGGVAVLREGFLVDGRVAAGDHAGVGLEGLVGLVCGIVLANGNRQLWHG
jgi:hypothetical protein